MKIENLSDLFLHTVKDIYFAENQIVKALPKILRLARRTRRPFIATITAGGTVTRLA